MESDSGGEDRAITSITNLFPPTPPQKNCPSGEKQVTEDKNKPFK